MQQSGVHDNLSDDQLIKTALSLSLSLSLSPPSPPSLPLSVCSRRNIVSLEIYFEDFRHTQIKQVPSFDVWVLISKCQFYFFRKSFKHFYFKNSKIPSKPNQKMAAAN